MNVALLKESKFLRKEDVGEGMVLTISHLTQENVALQGAEPDLKWCIHFSEVEKPLVVNGINAQMIAKLTGQEDTDNWSGKQVCLYNDENVSFGGRVIGGIRVRRAASAAPAQPRPATSGGAAQSAKTQLKAKFRAHPQFNKDLKPDDVNAYMLKHFGAKLDDLEEESAKDAINDFDHIVESIISDSIPF